MQEINLGEDDPADPAAPAVGARLSNKLYVVPDVDHKVTISEAAHKYVGDVLSGIDGGRAKIKDVIDDINEIFLEHNPKGWEGTKNKQKRAPDGGFTASAIKKIGKQAPANPERWSVKPTFYYDTEHDEIALLNDDSGNETDETE